MNQTDLLHHAVSALERLRFEYYITGSVAAIVFAEPRFTMDIDIVIGLATWHVERLLAEFPEPDFYVSREAAVAAAQRPSQFNVLHPTAGKIDFYVFKETPFDESCLARARRMEIVPGLTACVSAPEDIILNKLLFYRESRHERHPRDIASMLRVSGHLIDRPYLDRWAARLGVTHLLHDIQKDVDKGV